MAEKRAMDEMSILRIEPGFVPKEKEFASREISGVLLLDEKEFYLERDRLDLNSADDIRKLLSIIDINIKRESFVARLYDSLTSDIGNEETKEMLGRFVSDEKVHVGKLKESGSCTPARWLGRLGEEKT